MKSFFLNLIELHHIFNSKKTLIFSFFCLHLLFGQDIVLRFLQFESSHISPGTAADRLKWKDFQKMATYHVSSGGTRNNIISENDTMTAIDGGVQVVLDLQAAPQQIIYLDFDGELTKYRNADLDLEFDDVQVEDSMLTPDRIAGIIATLNTDFSVYNVLFSSERPKDTVYSTIFVGKTSAFDQYGNFNGIAETVDLGNRIKNDNAFVLLDAASSDSDIVSTIAHEAGHLIGTLDHGGDGLYAYTFYDYAPLGGFDLIKRPLYERYDQTYYYSFSSGYSYYYVVQKGYWHLNSITKSEGYEYYCYVEYTNIVFAGNNDHYFELYVGSGGTASNITLNRGTVNVRHYNPDLLSNPSYSDDHEGGTVNNITVNSLGKLIVYSGGTATNVTENGGYVYVADGANATFAPNAFTGELSSGEPTVHSGTTSVDTTLGSSVVLHVYSGGIAHNTIIHFSGRLEVSSGGTASSTMVNSGGSFLVVSGGSATSATVNPGGKMRVDYMAGTATIMENGGFVGARTELPYYSGIMMPMNLVAINESLVSFIPNSFSGLVLSGDSATVHSGTTANYTIVGTGGKLEVYSGGSANNTVLSGGTQQLGFIDFYNTKAYANGSYISLPSCIQGGTANNTIISSGSLIACSGGVANSVTVCSGGRLVLGCVTSTYVDDHYSSSYVGGGIANNVIVHSGGTCIIGADGALNDTVINRDGYFELYSGCSLNRIILNSGIDFLISDGIVANDTTVNESVKFGISSGGMADGTVINSGGSLEVFDGGTANNTTVSSGGYCSVASGGSMSDCTVYTGGSMYLAEGARLEGITTIGAGGQLSFADSGTTIDGTINLLLDIPAVEHTTAFLFNFKSTYSFDTTNLTLTVDENVAPGTFFLIDKSEDVTSDITITVTGTGENAGAGVFTIYDVDNRIYEPVTIGNKVYSLERKQEEGQENEGLYLSIVENSPISDAAYEYIARWLAYESGHKNYKEGDILDFAVNEEGRRKKYFFCVQKIYDTWGGFDAILLERRDADGNSLYQSILACGGTEDAQDGFSDILDAGIGYNQFADNFEEVYNDCKFLVDGGSTISFTGHSLGGALAQWFAGFSFSLGEVEDLVTFNSPGLPATVGGQAITSLTSQAKIKNIRHYISDGDIVSMAGDYFLSKATKSATCTVFVNTTESYLENYVLSQHCDLFFLNTLGFKSKGPNLTVVASGNPNFVSRGDFSYLTLYSDVNITVSNSSLRNVLEAVPIPAKDGGGYWLFNKQYAKLINLLTGIDLAFANSVVTRAGTEKNRKKELMTLKKLTDQSLTSDLFLGYLELGEVNTITNANISPGAVIRSLKYSFQNNPYAFFDFTNQKFIWNPSISTEIVRKRSASDLTIKAVLPDTLLSNDGNLRVSINVPTYYDSDRYSLESIVSGSGETISTDSFYQANDSVWLFVDNPETEYYFNFSVNQSVTVEKALLDTSMQTVNKNSDEIEIRISDIDATGNDGTISALVKSESTPDGITVQLQQSGIAGMYSGTFSLSSLASRDTDEHLTIVYEDADNGTGVAETIEKVIDIDNIEWPDYSGLVIPDVPDFFVGDFNSDGKAMLVTESDGVISVYSDGAAWGGLTLDDGWYVAGIGDFNGDGADDFLRVNIEGYVVGEMSNGDGTFSPQVLNFLNDGWDILGTGDFNGNGTDDVLIANPTAASETIGLLGYWESGVTWTLINGYSAEWEMVATGDFNGDGKCDMLWRNWFEGDGGLTYNAYCTWIVDDPIDWRMVSVANPAEWDFLCSGDFDGDKMNDIAMINDAGVVGIWGVNDGYLSSWSILSAVTSEWTLAGVGDFNGDGTDDIAWCNTETELVGCWQIENKELASWQILATLE